MKIVWILDSINTLNGMVQVVIGLSNYFAEHGHKVLIYSFFSQESAPFFKLSSDVSVKHLGQDWRLSRLDKHRLLGQIMQSCDADILLTCNEWANSSSVLNKRKFKGKLIITQHLSSNNFSTRRKLVNGLLHRFADKVVVLTAADKAFYTKFGINNVQVIPNAIYITPQETPDKQHMICSVGRVESVKGFDMLIAAFSQVARDFPTWKLRIWGDGSLRPQLLSRIDELGLSHQIEMPGVTKQVADELAKSSIFALSSRWEGSPLVLIEAMASRNAIIAFNLPCIKDVLSPDSGIIVPSGNVDELASALRKMISDEPLRKSCSTSAYSDSKKFSIENIGQMWFDLFSQLID